MYKLNQIDKIIKCKKTLLGVGPMSQNVIDSAIELSDEYMVPLILIASRRQIDSNFHGGGYVNNWSTEKFSKYVKKKSKKKFIMMARDHGGPWQNTNEIKDNLNLDKAIESAKRSFLCDIKNDFSFIHIDTSVDIYKKKIKADESLKRIFEFYEFCYKISKENNKEILFEIGTEEQSGSTNTFEELEYVLQKINEFTKKKNLPKLNFIVIQSGTKVMERRNIGSFETSVRIENEIPVEIQLLKMIEICNKNKVYMKEHNADYLTNESLSWHPRLGIHSANVAPEFGVCETVNIVENLKKNKMKDLLNEFIYLCVKSKKWEKWAINKNEITDLEKTLICGHYLFSNPEFLKIKKELSYFLKKKKIDLDKLLKSEIKKSIKRYMKNFRLINA